MTQIVTPKPWYLSKTVIGALLAATAGFISVVVSTLEPNAPASAKVVLGGLSTAGGVLALVGRMLATQPLST
jgi:hypothetical protein